MTTTKHFYQDELCPICEDGLLTYHGDEEIAVIIHPDIWENGELAREEALFEVYICQSADCTFSNSRTGKTFFTKLFMGRDHNLHSEEAIEEDVDY
jgi:hypothetical protein